MKKILVVLTLLLAVNFVAAGDLNPPAAPSSTMKTLGEVEPRIPLGQADFPVTISQSGSYYLTENVTLATGHNAFTVYVDNVSIDLMGYTVIGHSSGGSGVYMNERKKVTVSNGTFDGFGGKGVHDGYPSSQNYNFINLTIKNCGTGGIQVTGSGHSVEGCKIINCGDGRDYAHGIYVGSQSRVVNCLVKDNSSNSGGSYVYGIRGGYGCEIIGNIVSGNFSSSTATYIYCILATNSSVICDNVVESNGDSADCVNFYGIYASNGVNCIGNSVSKNAESIVASSTIRAIYATYCCLVKENTMYDNFTSSTSSAYGLYASNSCLVDANVAYSNEGTNLSASASCVVGTNLAP